MEFQDHFSAQAAVYAKARPTYPMDLFAQIAALAPGRELAWDAGSGNGQAAVALATHFDRVLATEPSEAQLAQAQPHARVTYRRSAETALELKTGSVDLVTVAQAAHWFNRDVFYAEVSRVLKPRGVVALWTYELCSVSPEIDEAVLRFYRGPIDPFWPPERKHTETGYRLFDFPFEEMPFPTCSMRHTWMLYDFVTYLRTWSAVARYRQANGVDPVSALENELQPLWGEAPRVVEWPLAGRIGRLPD